VDCGTTGNGPLAHRSQLRPRAFEKNPPMNHNIPLVSSDPFPARTISDMPMPRPFTKISVKSAESFEPGGRWATA
jgi:hypothetical protein